MKLNYILLITITSSILFACKTDTDISAISSMADNSVSELAISTLNCKHSPIKPAIELSRAEVSGQWLKLKFNSLFPAIDKQLTNEDTTPCNPYRVRPICVLNHNTYFNTDDSGFFNIPLKDGKHLLFAYLNNQCGIGIKSNDAHLLYSLEKEGENLKMERINDPHLYFCQSTHSGFIETDGLLLDFYLANIDFSQKHYIEATIGDEYTFQLKKWKPYVVKGLPKGTHELKLTLKDSRGVLLRNRNNPIYRTVVVQ